MPRVLLVSYCYPPLAAPESWLSAKAVASLKRVGVEVDVVHASPAWWHSADRSLVDYAHAAAREVHVIHTPAWLPAVQPFRWLRQFPDSMRLLQRRALRVIDTLDPGSYDAMVTWSQWHSVHLVGLAVKRRHPGLRWVAHFSDPWLGNPLEPRHRLARAVNVPMERAVLGSADVLEFTTREARDLTLAPYPAPWAARAVVVPHVFDGDLYGAGSPTGRDELVVRYVGSFYGARRPDALFAGLVTLLRIDPRALDGVRIEIVGKVDRDMLRSPVALALPKGLVTVRPPVDYRTSLALMRDADLLLLVDAPADTNVFLASKLVDYVGAQRPIAGVTPPGSAADLIARLGGVSCDPLDPAGIAEMLGASITALRSGRSTTWGDADVAAAYDAAVVGSRRRRITLGEGS